MIRWSMKRVRTSMTSSRFHFVAKIELVDRSVFNLYALWARIYIYTTIFPPIIAQVRTYTGDNSYNDHFEYYHTVQNN